MDHINHISRELILSSMQGDSRAVGVLFESFRPRLYAHALRICGNTPEAQDAVQDTFITAFTHLRQLKEPDSLYPWLKRILFNTCYGLLRPTSTRLQVGQFEPKDVLIRQSIDEHFDAVSNQQCVSEAMSRLSEELRCCVMLRYFSEFNSYQQIAAVLDIPVGTVRSRLFAAREQLAKLCLHSQDAGDKTLRQSGEWSNYYRRLWSGLYDDYHCRNELLGHLHPMLNIRFTSGKTGKGRHIIEKEVDADLHYGSRLNVTNVSSCGNISVLEGFNSNTKEFPDRCPPSSVLVLFRQNLRVGLVHIFDSPRS